MTLTCLKNGGVPRERIYVFVANDEEKKKYEEGIPKELYGRMIVGVKGLQQQRNFIGEYFPVGKHIVQMDDDVRVFKKIVLPSGATKKRDLKSKLEEIKNLPKLFELGFDECKKHKAHLWGIAPVANAGFMKDEVDYGLVFCPGWAWGVINRRIALHLPQEDGSFKEDYERTLQNAVIDGGVVRLSGVCGITKMYASGGLDADRAKREAANRRNVKKLMERYPNLVFVKKLPRKRNLEGTEIRLARQVPESSRQTLAEVKGGRQPAATPPLNGSGQNLRDADITDKDNAAVAYVPIRNKSRYEETRDTLLDALKNSSKKLPLVASRAPVIGKDAGKTSTGAKKTSAETITFGFGSIQGKGHGFFATNKKYPEIFKACIDFGNQCVPKGWKYNAITLNHNTKTKVHIDGHNVGRSVIVGIGDYTGGDIRVWKEPSEEFFEKGRIGNAQKSANQMLSESALQKAGITSKTFSLKNRPLMFNGGILPHATEPFEASGEKGEGRYTLIFYSHSKLPPSGDSAVNNFKNDTIGIGRGKGGISQPDEPPMC